MICKERLTIIIPVIIALAIGYGLANAPMGSCPVDTEKVSKPLEN